MVTKFFKKKSKRTGLKQKAKIRKKVGVHNRKIKKAKQLTKARKRKDPGVPNAYPFKEEVLQDAVEWKRKKDAERELKKEERKNFAKKMDDIKRTGVKGLLKNVMERQDEFGRKRGYSKISDEDYAPRMTVLEQSLKTYYKEFSKVVEAADVVLQVLDARDPLGSRCRQVEEAVLNSGTDKKLVLILNKIDLVPKENIMAWLKHLRNELPTLAFRCSTQSQNVNLGHNKTTLSELKKQWQKSRVCLGADSLMSLLANYSRQDDIRKTIRVGVVGFPNTGKSSLINSMKRSRACHSGSRPGITKEMKEVSLDKNIKLLDSPGVVFAQNRSDASSVLSNCINIVSVQDPLPPVIAILNRCQKSQIMKYYKIISYKNPDEFLALLADRFGYVLKTGIPDIDAAAKRVLNDWNRGDILYYTQPPIQHTLPRHISAKIVTQMSAAFNIDALLGMETDDLNAMEAESNSEPKSMLLQLSTPDIAEGRLTASDPVIERVQPDEDMEGDSDSSEEDVDMDDTEMSSKTVTFRPTKKAKKVVPTKKPRMTGVKTYGEMSTAASKVMNNAESAVNPQRNRALKKLQKQKKKDAKRITKASDKLADDLEDAFQGFSGGGGESYSFKEAFKGEFEDE